MFEKLFPCSDNLELSKRSAVAGYISIYSEEIQAEMLRLKGANHGIETSVREISIILHSIL